MEKDTHTQNHCQCITLLRATGNDSKNIWEWRNDELTKQMSITTESIGWEAHSDWYEKSLVNPNRYLYIGYINHNEKIGMCRFDLDTKSNIAEVSININPQYRNKKLSSQLLSVAIATFFEQYKVDLVATIKKINIGSIQCFTKSGFTFEREDSQCNYYKRSSSIECSAK